jgi:uncharacterized membrane protein YfhO
MDNTGIFLGYPNIQAFHSIVPGSIMDFYPAVGVTRDVGSRPEVSHYPLRSLLSVHWLFDSTKLGGSFGNTETGENLQMIGYTYAGNQLNYDIWENQNYIPLGFSYDHFITEGDFNAISDDVMKEKVLLKGVVMGQLLQNKYADILTRLDMGRVDYSDMAFAEDCIERSSMSCTKVTRDNTGFTATFLSDRDRLVFFSVPWEAGWSAKVNDIPVDIEKVNIGFMAVRVPAGESTIRFDYMTPGLIPGLILSIFAFITLAGYLFYFSSIKKEQTFLSYIKR